MLEGRELDYLWEVFYSQFVRGDENRVRDLTASFYERGLSFPDEVESLMLKFWETWDVNHLIALMKKTVTGYFFDPARHTWLIALLMAGGHLLPNEAASLLLMPGRKIMRVEPAIQNVIDVAWLIKEDVAVGFESEKEETLLKDALAEVLKGSMH